MMLDDDVVAVSPVQRLLACSRTRAGSTGSGISRPRRKAPASCSRSRPHQHWHIDVSYINVGGTFYFLCSRPRRLQPLHRALGKSARSHEGSATWKPSSSGPVEHYPGVNAADHQRQRSAVHRQDFKEFIRLCGMTHVRTSPYYPQSNGKLERWHQSLKSEGNSRPGP